MSTENSTIAAQENEVINGQNDQNEQVLTPEQIAQMEAEEAADLWNEEKYNNETLTRLRAEAIEADQSGQKFKFGSKGRMEAFELLAKLTSQIRAEIASIKKQAAIAEQQAKQAKQVALFEDLCQKYFELGKSFANEVPAEIYDEQASNAKVAFDEITNQYVYGSAAKTANVTAQSNGSASHGNIRAEIEAGYIAAIASGLNRTEAAKSLIKPENGGTGIYARGSVNTYIKDYLEGNGINKP